MSNEIMSNDDTVSLASIFTKQEEASKLTTAVVAKQSDAKQSTTIHNKNELTTPAVVVEPQRPRLLSSLYSVLFILTWGLVGLAAFRNTLTW